MENEVGYMQVHIRLYRNKLPYEEFVINTFDECFFVKTRLVSSEHKAIPDPQDDTKKVAQMIIKVDEDDYTFTLLIPIHQSKEWEITHISEEYSVGFYCILGIGS